MNSKYFLTSAIFRSQEVGISSLWDVFRDNVRIFLGFSLLRSNSTLSPSFIPCNKNFLAALFSGQKALLQNVLFQPTQKIDRTLTEKPMNRTLWKRGNDVKLKKDVRCCVCFVVFLLNAYYSFTSSSLTFWKCSSSNTPHCCKQLKICCKTIQFKSSIQSFISRAKLPNNLL